MDVVGGHQGDSRPAAHFDGPFHHDPLYIEVVVLNLEEVAIAEQLAEPGGDLHGPVDVRRSTGAAQQRPAELARRAAA
jgi:hypothetical protein